MIDDQLVLFSTLAVQGALEREVIASLPPTLTVRTVFDPTAVLLRRIKDGERPDVIVAVTGDVDALRQRGLVEPGVAVATTGVGVGLAASAPVPDLSTVPRLVAALKTARSVAYSRSGASGQYFARLLEQLGIAGEINSRATVVDKGFTGLAVLDGRADLAIQQISELKFVDGINVIGPLPAEVEHRTEFSAAPFVGASDTARELVRLLTTARAREAFQRAGLEC